MNMTIDRDAIKKVVMRGQSVPAGIVAPPFVNGYSKELDSIPKVDATLAKKLLADAGYADGFSVTLNCPNDRYVSDEGICQATASMLARIGIKVKLVAQSKSLHFPLIEKDPPETEFYLLGWGVPTYDSHYVFSFLYHSRTNKEGGFNGTRYADPKIDRAIDSLTQEIDEEKRNITISEIWKTLQEETIYLPVHHQTLAFAMKDVWDFPTSPQNSVHMKNYAPKQ
jgi:peptide/nickel transport system substrate-binding protein